MTDLTEVVQAAKNGDKRSLHELYDSFYDDVYYLSLKITKNVFDAEDIVQDSFIKAFTSISSLKENNKFKTWLLSITSNNCKNFLTKKKPFLFKDSQEESFFIDNIEEECYLSLPENCLEKKATSNMVIKFINELPEDQRLCLILFYYENFSIDEISASLDIPVGTVKSRLYYAKKMMKEKITKEEEDDSGLYCFPLGFLINYSFKFETGMFPIWGKITIRKTIFGTKKSKNIFLFLSSKKISALVVAVATAVSFVTGFFAPFKTEIISKEPTLKVSSIVEKVTEDIPEVISDSDEVECFAADNEFILRFNGHKIYSNNNSIFFDLNKIVNNSGSFFNFYDGNIFYIFNNDIYQYSFLTKTNAIVYNGKVDCLYLKNNKLIFTEENGKFLMQFDLKSKEPKLLHNLGSDYVIGKNNIYYKEKGTFNIIKTTYNSNDSYVAIKNSTNKMNFNYRFCNKSNSFYFADFEAETNGILYCSNTLNNSKETIKLLPYVDFSICDNTIIYETTSGELYYNTKSKNKVLFNGTMYHITDSSNYSAWYSTDNNMTYIIDCVDFKTAYVLDSNINNFYIYQNSIYYSVNNNSYVKALSTLNTIVL